MLRSPQFHFELRTRHEPRERLAVREDRRAGKRRMFDFSGGRWQ